MNRWMGTFLFVVLFSLTSALMAQGVEEVTEAATEIPEELDDAEIDEAIEATEDAVLATEEVVGEIIEEGEELGHVIEAGEATIDASQEAAEVGEQAVDSAQNVGGEVAEEGTGAQGSNEEAVWADVERLEYNRSPIESSGIAGGPVDASTIAPDCVGFIGQQPNHILTVVAGLPDLRIQGGDQDLTLVIMGNEATQCFDDSFGRPDPFVNLWDAFVLEIEGELHIYVGTKDGGEAPYTLTIEDSAG